MYPLRASAPCTTGSPSRFNAWPRCPSRSTTRSSERYTNAYAKMGFHSDQALDLRGGSHIAVFSCYRHPDPSRSAAPLGDHVEGARGRTLRDPPAPPPCGGVFPGHQSTVPAQNCVGNPPWPTRQRMAGRHIPNLAHVCAVPRWSTGIRGRVSAAPGRPKRNARNSWNSVGARTGRSPSTTLPWPTRSARVTSCIRLASEPRGGPDGRRQSSQRGTLANTGS